MGKIIVLTDSTCDLSKELVEKYDIKVVPLHVNFPGEERDYLDGVNLFPDEIYKKVDETGKTPKTGARSIGEFIEDFKKILDEGNQVIYTGIGSGLSSSYKNAVIAAQEFENGAENIEIVDSQTLSTGTGLLVLKMCQLRDEGLDIHEIAKRVREIVPHLSVKFCIDRLDYLYKGGRCSGMTKLVGGMLAIHPIAKTIDNKLTVAKLPRGKYRKAVDLQIEEFKKDLPNIDKTHIFITHSGHMDGEEEYIYEQLKQLVDPSCIHITRAGSVISSHCGPKTIGILYILYN